MQTAELLTVEEVAERLRCHPQTVRRFIWSGKLDHVKVGGMVRVPETALQRLIEEGGERSRDDDRNKGVNALRAVVHSRRASVEDVRELERLIDEGEQAADWGSPV
jgi:excisionase family DNA binding protein